MSAAWFFCRDLRTGRIELPPAELQHATRSRRLRPGDSVVLFDGHGHIARATLASETDAPPVAGRNRRHEKSARGTHFQVDGVEICPPATRRLSLVVPGCKGERLPWMIEKCTELGVTNFILAEFERSVVHVGSTHAAKLERIAIEASKQCHRAWLPEIRGAPRMLDLVGKLPPAAWLVADAQAPTAFGPWLASQQTMPASLVVVIGPEGGLSPEEMTRLTQANAQAVALADYILRVETAAVAVAATWSAAEPRAAGGSDRALNAERQL